MHHSDTHVSWLTSASWHPINLLTMRGVGGSVMLLLGFPLVAIIFNSMLRAYYGFFIHADVPWTYGKLGQVFRVPRDAPPASFVKSESVRQKLR